MLCPKCHAEVPADAAFCPKCGAAVAGVGPAAARSGTPTERMQVAAGAAPQEPEHELWRGGYSAKAMYGGWVFAAVVTVGALLLGFLSATPYKSAMWIAIAIAVPAMWIFLLLTLLLRRWSVSYTLTSQRFLIERGILRRVHDRVLLIDIDDVSFAQGLMERMFGVGTITLTSTDASDPKLRMQGVYDVQRIANLIDDARREERRKRAIYMANV